MTAKILLFAFGVVAMSSCSVYKSGQTPDDVYYSPAKEVTEYVRVENDEHNSAYPSRNRTYDEYSEDYRNDRFMRLSMYNRSRWGAFDDYYWNNNLMFNNYYGYNSWTNPWNSYYYWNSFYNPYCSPGFIVSDPYAYKGGSMVSTSTSRPMPFNYNAYVNRNYNNNNLYFNNGGNASSRISSRYNNRYVTGAGNSSESNSLRKLFNTSNNSAGRSTYYNTNNSNPRSSNGGYSPSNNSNYSQPSSRSYTPSSSSSSSGGGVSSGGSSSGGSISRPGRN